MNYTLMMMLSTALLGCNESNRLHARDAAQPETRLEANTAVADTEGVQQYAEIDSTVNNASLEGSSLIGAAWIVSKPAPAPAPNDTFIDFEQAPVNQSPLAYLKALGIAATSTGEGDLVVRRSTRKGEAKPPLDQIAWRLSVCLNRPCFNRVLMRTTEDRVGRQTLSTTSSLTATNVGMKFNLQNDAKAVSLELIEHHWGMQWTLIGYDAQGKQVTHAIKAIAQRGPSKKITGNTDLVFMNIEPLEAGQKIRSFTLTSVNRKDEYGFGVENIRIHR